MAEQRGAIDLDVAVSDLLGRGWSAADATTESTVTVRHLLTMTSGLAPGTLTARHPAGTVWEYNTEAYQRLLPVLEAATGDDLQSVTRRWLFDPIGIDPAAGWVRASWRRPTRRPVPRPRPVGAGHGPVRSPGVPLGRLGRGRDRPRRLVTRAWSPLAVRPDYGMLWWLLGRSILRRVGALPDAVAALGKDDQKIHVVPSARLVLVRQGDAARGTTLSVGRFDRTLVQRIAEVLAG